MPKPKRCSCTESEHLRAALQAIERQATTHTGLTYLDDLAQIANLANQGLRLRPLVDDPAIQKRSINRSR